MDTIKPFLSLPTKQSNTPGLISSWSAYDASSPTIKQKYTLARLRTYLPRRLFGFSLVGGGVLLGGIVLLFILVQWLHVEKNLAYFIQAVASIETNFFLNRFLNWRERDGHLFAQWFKFHATSAITFPVNQALFAVLTWLGVHYLLVTLFGAGIAAIVNYLTNDRLVFHHQDIATKDTDKLRAVLPLIRFPHVGVVIPVRNSQRTIQRCIASVQRQDYQGAIDIFIVGNPPEQDTTWQAFNNQMESPHIHILQIPRPGHVTGRDANMKRYTGTQAALQAGVEVVALLDSQVEAPQDWLLRAIQLLHEHSTDALAGISCHQPSDMSFSSVYQDASLFSEWPRYGKGFTLRRYNFGQKQYLPITANFIFTRHALLYVGKVFPSLSIDTGWDDFQIIWNFIQKGCTIFCTDQVRVYRNHRQKFRLFKQLSSGMSGVAFYRDYPQCPYAQRRITQMALVLGLLFTISIVFLLLLTIGNIIAWEETGMICGTFLLLYSLSSLWKARDIRGLFFFPLDVLHIGFWVAGALYALFYGGFVHPEVSNAFVRLR